MTTLRLPTPDELEPDDRQVLERVAKRLGTAPDKMSMIWLAQSHWPQHLEANLRQTLYSFRFQGQIPTLFRGRGAAPASRRA
jgi:hypothetical protein